MSTNLPEDVVIGILSRLPVKSLMRFRCVCKSWYGLIRNPTFIEKHLNFMKNNDGGGGSSERFLAKPCPEITRKPVVSLLTCSNQNETLDLLDLPFYKEEFNGLLLLGPVNGIYCLYGVPFVLLNPAIRDFKVLPVSPIPLPPGTDVVFESPGFGFDPKTNDYKLFRIMSLWHEESGTVHDPPQIEVYTLSTDSWRKIDAAVRISGFDCSWVNTYLNGVYYWCLNDDGDAGILSLDMGDEVFRETPVPMRFSRDETVGVLALLNESLALVLYDLRGTEKCFDIWVMNICGAEESWSKHVTIGPLSGVEKPLGFGKNGALFLESSDGQLVLYDPDAQVIKNLRVHGLRDSFQVAIYRESLVLIKGGNELKQHNNSSDIGLFSQNGRIFKFYSDIGVILNFISTQR